MIERSRGIARCGIFALLIVLAGTAGAVTGQTDPPTRPTTLTPNQTGTPPASLTALTAEAETTLTVEVTAEFTVEPVCPNAPPTRLIVGERGRVMVEDPRPLNIRAGAGTTNDIVGQIPARGIFFVVEGPQCSQRYSWYFVSYRVNEDEVLTGWIAEGDDNAYFVELYPPGW